MHWGNKLMLGFMVFATMMGYLVYRSFSTEFQLVEKDYYKSELKYQELIDASRQREADAATISVSANDKGVSLELPVAFRGNPVSGEVLLYCAAEAGADRRFTLAFDSQGQQLLEGLPPGYRYEARIRWKWDGKEYYQETPVNR